MATASDQLPTARRRTPVSPTGTNEMDILEPMRPRRKRARHRPFRPGDPNSGTRSRGQVIPKNRRTTARAFSATTITGEVHDDEHEDDHGDDHNHGKARGEDDPNDHSHHEVLCQQLTSQHKLFIQENLDTLKKKCDQYEACTNELYSAENFHGVLQGDPIQLSNICGLMYANGGGKYTTLNKECTSSERRAIRESIGHRLAKKLTPPEEPAWRKLDKCIKEREEPSPSNPAVDIVCRLKENSTVLCDKKDVDEKTEIFFNNELEHLHCSCAAINSEAANMNKGSTVPKEVRIAVGCGILGLILILIVVVIVLCVRHRKVKKRLSQHRIKYLPNPHDEASAIYQEIGDNPQAMSRDRAPMQVTTPGYHILERAPTLPARRVRPDNPAVGSVGSDDGEYLEPLPEPTEDQQNPSLPTNSSIGHHGSCSGEEPGCYLAQNPNAKSDEPNIVKYSENDYEKFVNRGNPKEDGGYSTLCCNKPTGNEMEHGESELPACDGKPELREGSDGDPEEPKYFVLEPQDNQSSELEPLTTTITQL